MILFDNRVLRDEMRGSQKSIIQVSMTVCGLKAITMKE